MTYEYVAAELEKRGISASASTVAQWFNGTRGKRMDADVLGAILDILGMTFEEARGGPENKAKFDEAYQRARDYNELSAEGKALVDSLIKQLRGKV